MPHAGLRLVWSSSWQSARDEARLDSLYDEVIRVGHAIADAHGLALPPDEWPCYVRDWILASAPDVMERDLAEDDVLLAFAAFEIGVER